MVDLRVFFDTTDAAFLGVVVVVVVVVVVGVVIVFEGCNMPTFLRGVVVAGDGFVLASVELFRLAFDFDVGDGDDSFSVGFGFGFGVGFGIVSVAACSTSSSCGLSTFVLTPRISNPPYFSFILTAWSTSENESFPVFKREIVDRLNPP